MTIHWYESPEFDKKVGHTSSHGELSRRVDSVWEVKPCVVPRPYLHNHRAFQFPKVHNYTRRNSSGIPKLRCRRESSLPACTWVSPEPALLSPACHYSVVLKSLHTSHTFVSFLANLGIGSLASAETLSHLLTTISARQVWKRIDVYFHSWAR